MKRFLRKALACAVVLAAHTSAFALDYTIVDGVRYILGSYAIVCPPQTGIYQGDLVIPEKIEANGKSYTVRLGYGAFKNSEITSITFSQNIYWTDIPGESGSSVGSNLASNSFSIGGGSGGSSTNPTAGNAKLYETLSEEFDSCLKLKAIYTTDTAGNVTNSDNGCVFSYSNYFVYAPVAADGTVDFSTTVGSICFDAAYLTGRRKLEGIIFPAPGYVHMTPGFKDCPSLASLKRKGSNYDQDGILYSSEGYCEAVPPAHRETLELTGGIGSMALAYCDITNLTYSGDGDNIAEDAMLGFRGNVTLTKKYRNGSSLFLYILKALARADSENYTLKCDPANREEAAKYWKGKIENNDFYIESVQEGVTSVTITFGGDPEIYGKFISVTPLYESWGFDHKKTTYKYGESKKLDASGKIWNVTKLPSNRTFNLLLIKRYSDSGEEEITIDESFKTKECGCSFVFSDIKQTSANVTVKYSDEELFCDGELDNVFVEASYGTVKKISDRQYAITNLPPRKECNVSVGYRYVQNNNELPGGLGSGKFTTKPLDIRYKITAGQVTATLDELEVLNQDDSWGDSRPYKWYVKGSKGAAGLDEAMRIIRDANEESREVLIYFSGSDDLNYITLGTVKLQPFLSVPVVSPTGFETGLVKGDAENVRVSWSWQGSGKDKVEFVNGAVSGLKANSSVRLNYSINYKLPGENFDRYLGGSFPIGLPALTLTTLQPKVTGTGTAIVCAETNMAEYETRGGFQWKKYDAPASLAPTEGYALVIGDEMQGAIKNLSMANYYKVRAFYRAADGTEVFGDWVTFDPSDISYFDPTVHTYRAMDVTHNAARVRGAVLEGSDEISEQGFEYAAEGETAGDAARVVTKAPLAPSGVMTVQGSGQMMECELTGLEPDTRYVYRSYVRTAKGETYYGETLGFTTEHDPASGVDAVVSAPAEASLIGRYNLNGVPVGEGYLGFVIELYSDGTSRKMIVK